MRTSSPRFRLVAGWAGGVLALLGAAAPAAGATAAGRPIIDLANILPPEALPQSTFDGSDLDVDELVAMLDADDDVVWYEQAHSDRTTPEQQATWDSRLKEIKHRQHERNQRRQRRRAQQQEDLAYDLAELNFRGETAAGSIPRGWSYKDVGPVAATGVLDAHLQRARLNAAAGSACDDDPLASSEAGAPCAYSCETLAEFYYPDAPEVVCYLYDQSTNSWPGKTCSTRGSTTCTAMGPSEELLQKKQDWLDWHIFTEGTTEGDDTTDRLEFQVGAGATCVNVTVLTEVLGVVQPGAPANHTEQRCLLEGYHVLDHSAVAAQGSTQVIGQAAGDVYHAVSHDRTGTSDFTIGSCEDIWIRVQTAAGSTGPLSFSLDDGGHNGPWTVDFAEANLEVGGTYDSEPMCLFDNDFNLTKTGSAGWRGQITVLSKVPDNTITIPTGAPEDQSYPSNFAWYPDEDARPKWIVHGREDADGIPVKLDARLKSGGLLVSEEGCGDFSVSYASIVLRKVRFSNQKAVLDKFAAFRTHSTAGDANSHGAALDYTGGWGADVTLDGCVFDHLYASEGAGIMIDGQLDDWARRHHAEALAGNLPGAWTLREADTLLIEDKYTLTWTETDNLFWECHGRVGGGVRWTDSHPKNITISGNQYVDNVAFVSSGIGDATYSNCYDEDTGILGRSFISLSGVEMTDGGSPTDRIPGFTLSPFRFGPLSGHWEVPDREATAHIHTFDDVRIYDQHLSCMPGFTACESRPVHFLLCAHHFSDNCAIAFFRLTDNTGNCAGGCLHSSYSNIDLSDLTGTWTVYAWTAQAVFHWADDFAMTNSRIVGGGIVDDTETAVADGGGIHAIISTQGSLSNTYISGRTAAFGGAATFAGSGYVEIVDCVFEGNVAWEQGGALVLKASGGNLIQGCIFFNNYVGVTLPKDVDVTVRVYTGVTK
jgi:hypothetical protein